MAKIVSNELYDEKLDFFVAQALGYTPSKCSDGVQWIANVADKNSFIYCAGEFCPSSDWGQAGILIANYNIGLFPPSNNGFWEAYISYKAESKGSSPLEAAMRCFVSLKFGNEFDDEGVWQS